MQGRSFGASALGLLPRAQGQQAGDAASSLFLVPFPPSAHLARLLPTTNGTGHISPRLNPIIWEGEGGQSRIQAQLTVTY